MPEKKPVSLKDKILADLASSAPSTILDPELDEGDITSAKVAKSDADAGEVGSDSGFGNLRKRAFYSLAETDKKYAGLRISRKTLKEWDTGSGGSGSDDIGFKGGGNDDGGVGNVAVDSDSGDNDDIDSAVHPDRQDGEANVWEDQVVESADDADDDVTSNAAADDDNDDDMSGSYDDGEGLEDEEGSEQEDTELVIDIKKMPADLAGAAALGGEPTAENSDDVLPFSRRREEDDVAKGRATKAQIDMWDRLLESRIRLQKSVSICNYFPQGEAFDRCRRVGGSQLAELLTTAKTSLSGLLNKLLEVQTELLNRNTDTKHILTGGKPSKKSLVDDNDEIATDTEDEQGVDEVKEADVAKDELDLPSKRKHTLTIEECEEELCKRHKAFGEYRDGVINKWYERTRLSSGKVGSKSFGSFDRSTLAQIKQVLSDKDRLLKRTRLKRTPYRVLGKAEVDAETAPEGGADSHLKDYDSNVFDDSDFYHELLKELIERKSNINQDDPVAVGRQWLELQKLRTKVKRKVDTRASKGRKTRYNVHSKLVNFMAPQQVGSMSDQARNDLFCSLFGKIAPAASDT